MNRFHPRYHLWLAPLLLAFVIGPAASLIGQEIPAAESETPFAIGADLSFLAEVESNGTVFKDEGIATPGLEIFHNHGYNWIRLRLFYDPDQLPNDLEYTARLAADAKKHGYKFLLNFHYSDTWADPGKQFLPKAWKKKSHEELVEAVRQHTRDTIIALREADAMPDMVQIGNEVIQGMLWPDGKLPERWPEFAELFRAGVQGVKDACGQSGLPIMMHIDRGGDRASTKHFFDKCVEHNIEFDIIGQSYYPWWHGSLDDLRKNLAFMANEYQKPIVLVEVAYNWRPTEYRNQAGPFPESPAGQRAFLEAVVQAVHDTPNGLGQGVFWWEPAVKRGPIYGRGMFNEQGDSLPVLQVFDDQ